MILKMTVRTLRIINRKGSRQSLIHAVPDNTALLFAKFLFNRICLPKDELRHRNDACSR
jgi:hypothetical protein